LQVVPCHGCCHIWTDTLGHSFFTQLLVSQRYPLSSMQGTPTQFQTSRTSHMVFVPSRPLCIRSDPPPGHQAPSCFQHPSSHSVGLRPTSPSASNFPWTTPHALALSSPGQTPLLVLIPHLPVQVTIQLVAFSSIESASFWLPSSSGILHPLVPHP
jgi:hypothetical protein